MVRNNEKNHDTHHPANTPINSGGVIDTDDEAAGQFRSTDLHCIVAAALEGHDKHPTAYHVLRNNYTSLMCASYLGNHPYENTARSTIFMQQNITSTNKLDDVGRRGTNQLRLLERYLDVLVKHTTDDPALSCLSRRRIVKMIYFKL